MRDLPGGPKIASRLDQRMLSAGLGWFVAGLKASSRVDQKLLSVRTKHCFSDGPKNAFGWTRLVRGWTENFFPGRPKVASRVDQKLLPGWTKNCFSSGTKNAFGWTRLVRGWTENFFPGGPKVASRVFIHQIVQNIKNLLLDSIIQNFASLERHCFL